MAVRRDYLPGRNSAGHTVMLRDSGETSQDLWSYLSFCSCTIADLDFKYEHLFYIDLLRRCYLYLLFISPLRDFFVLIYLKKIRPPVDSLILLTRSGRRNCVKLALY